MAFHGIPEGYHELLIREAIYDVVTRVDSLILKKAEPSTPSNVRRNRGTWVWTIPITVETLTEPAKEISEKKRESIDDILYSPVSST